LGRGRLAQAAGRGEIIGPQIGGEPPLAKGGDHLVTGGFVVPPG
jgi:hypothetical protein